MRAHRSLLLSARGALGVSILALAGCASTPQATAEQDAEAKQFNARPDTGKREILRCCSLLENWAPGQRPLLR